MFKFLCLYYYCFTLSLAHGCLLIYFNLGDFPPSFFLLYFYLFLVLEIFLYFEFCWFLSYVDLTMFLGHSVLKYLGIICRLMLLYLQILEWVFPKSNNILFHNYRYKRVSSETFFSFLQTFGFHQISQVSL